MLYKSREPSTSWLALDTPSLGVVPPDYDVEVVGAIYYVFWKNICTIPCTWYYVLSPLSHTRRLIQVHIYKSITHLYYVLLFIYVVIGGRRVCMCVCDIWSIVVDFTLCKKLDQTTYAIYTHRWPIWQVIHILYNNIVNVWLIYRYRYISA